jgi:hypothetical protein
LATATPTKPNGKSMVVVSIACVSCFLVGHDKTRFTVVISGQDFTQTRKFNLGWDHLVNDVQFNNLRAGTYTIQVYMDGVLTRTNVVAVPPDSALFLVI